MENTPIIIPVDYDKPEAIAKAIEEGRFDYKYLGLELASIPLIGSGLVKREVYEVHFGRMVYTRDLPEAIKKRGRKLGLRGVFKFADPLTALLFACLNPDRQRQYQLGTLFVDNAGKLGRLFLGGDAGERDLHVRRGHPNSRYCSTFRFLAVCEPPLAA